MLKNLPRQYNPPGNGKKDMERPIFADKTEEAMIAALFGPGQMTKHGIPSYSWRDDSGSDTNGTQDGSGGSMSGSGSVSGTGGGGFGGQGGVTTGGRGGYTFSTVPGRPGQIGNYNTGGIPVGFGSQAGGIRGFGSPSQAGGPPPGVSQPVRPIPPPIQPPVQPPVTYPPVPMTKLQNYLQEMAAWRAQNPITNYASTFPARPGVSPMAPGLNSQGPWGAVDSTANNGNDMYGASLGGFRSTQGDANGVGGGRGGGGGRGW